MITRFGRRHPRDLLELGAMDLGRLLELLADELELPISLRELLCTRVGGISPFSRRASRTPSRRTPASRARRSEWFDQHLIASIWASRFVGERRLPFGVPLVLSRCYGRSGQQARFRKT